MHQKSIAFLLAMQLNEHASQWLQGSLNRRISILPNWIGQVDALQIGAPRGDPRLLKV